MNYTQPQHGTDDGWPWNCTRCGRTIYHDASVCQECDRVEQAASAAAATRSRAFVEWMRSQSYPGFVTRTSMIAGIELLLTALWIEVLFSGALPVPV